MCKCSDAQIENYRRRVSGPLLDRIDLQISVPRVEARSLSSDTRGETTQTVAGRVAEARRRQIERQGKPNAHLDLVEVRDHCRPEDRALRSLETYIDGGLVVSTADLFEETLGSQLANATLVVFYTFARVNGVSSALPSSLAGL